LQIISLGEKHEKPLIIIVNKCDLIKDKKDVELEIRSRLKSLKYCPIIFISALKKKNIGSLLKLFNEMIEESELAFGKRKLDNVLKAMTEKNPPKSFNGGNLKIYFLKQQKGLVQKFIFFVNNRKWLHFSYERYMMNYLREQLQIKKLPIRTIFKKSV
jgi:GTP-binding protein